jgi:hypothetical protein
MRVSAILNRIRLQQPDGLSKHGHYRLFLLCATLTIALLNPLLCILHCQMSHSHQAQHLHSGQSLGFFCDLGQQHASLPEDQLQSQAPQAATPRAVHDAVQPNLGVFGLVGSLYLIVERFSARLPKQLASPPLLPPPRA